VYPCRREVDVVEVVLEGVGKNALSLEMMAATKAAVEAAGGQPLLLRGAGDAFSAGLHLKEVGSLQPAGMQDFLETLMGLVEVLFRYPGPTVAAVNGHAIAGGLILALVCDHRVGPAGARAKIGLNEVSLGLRFPPRLLDVVRCRIPAHHHETVILRGPLLSPEEALAHGLLDELSDDVVATARARLEGLSKLPPVAYAALKDDLRQAVGRNDADAQRRFLEEVLPVWTGPELKQRIAAFLR
jgi:enoyl-CoA hydratase